MYPARHPHNNVAQIRNCGNHLPTLEEFPLRGFSELAAADVAGESKIALVFSTEPALQV